MKQFTEERTARTQAATSALAGYAVRFFIVGIHPHGRWRTRWPLVRAQNEAAFGTDRYR